MSKIRESILQNWLDVGDVLNRWSGTPFTCHVPDLLSRRTKFWGRSDFACALLGVDAANLSRKMGRLFAIPAAGSSRRQAAADVRWEASWA